jgi:hypothetical protein
LSLPWLFPIRPPPSPAFGRFQVISVIFAGKQPLPS